MPVCAQRNAEPISAMVSVMHVSVLSTRSLAIIVSWQIHRRPCRVALLAFLQNAKSTTCVLSIPPVGLRFRPWPPSFQRELHDFTDFFPTKGLKISLNSLPEAMNSVSKQTAPRTCLGRHAFTSYPIEHRAKAS